jgi:hypothetical protein
MQLLILCGNIQKEVFLPQIQSFEPKSPHKSSRNCKKRKQKHSFVLEKCKDIYTETVQ